MEEMKMEQKRELKNGLGIASFVIGIIGFLTGFIAIGMYFDIIAVILGVIALVSKKNKKGFAIAGLLIAALGFIIMMFYPIVWGNVIISLTLRTFYTQRKLVTNCCGHTCAGQFFITACVITQTDLSF